MIAVVHRVPRTSEAVQTWVDAGAGCFEADVQLPDDFDAKSRTGVVVSHFLPFLRVRGWLQHDGLQFRWGAGADPSLSEVIALLPPGSGVLLDPKETHPARRSALIDALADVLPERERFVVSTDYPGDLERYRGAGFRTWRTVKDARGLQDVLAGTRLPDAGVSIRHSLLDADTVRRLHERVRRVVAWTVNDASRARELVADGVDGVTTDQPAIARLVTGLDPPRT